MLRTPSAERTHLAAMAFIAASSLLACEPADPSCRAESFELVADDPAPDETRDPLLIREDGTRLVATWIHRPLVTTEEADVATPTTHASFALLTVDGHLEEQRSLPAPERLASYRGEPLGLGVVPVRDGALFHWIEVTQETDDTGRVRTSSELVAELVNADASAVEVPVPDARCDDCTLSVTSAAHGDHFLMVYSAAPAPGIARGTLGAPAAIVAVLFDAQGMVVAELDPGALGLAGSAIVEASGPFLAVRTAAATALLDPASGSIRGVLPGGAAVGRTLAPDANGERIWVATSSGGGAPTASVVSVELPLLLQALALDGRAVTPIERLSTTDGAGSLAAAATPSGVAVVFDAEGETYLARAGASGTKKGGDVGLGVASGRHRLIAVSDGELVDVAATTDAVRRRRVVCDP